MNQFSDNTESEVITAFQEKVREMLDQSLFRALTPSIRL